MLPKLTKPSLAILSLLGLSACTTVGPDYVHPKQAPLPSDWSVQKQQPKIRSNQSNSYNNGGSNLMTQLLISWLSWRANKTSI